MKVQDSQLTGKARVKKVEILDQGWCDDKWVTITITITITTIIIAIFITIIIAILLLLIINSIIVIEDEFSFKTCCSPTRQRAGRSRSGILGFSSCEYLFFFQHSLRRKYRVFFFHWASP